MPSPPSTSSLDVHPPSPRLLHDDIAHDSDAASSTTSDADLLSLLSSLSPPESPVDGIAAWRDTTPLARLLAHHRRDDLPPVAQESNPGHETDYGDPLAGNPAAVLAAVREPAAVIVVVVIVVVVVAGGAAPAPAHHPASEHDNRRTEAA